VISQTGRGKGKEERTLAAAAGKEGEKGLVVSVPRQDQRTASVSITERKEERVELTHLLKERMKKKGVSVSTRWRGKILIFRQGGGEEGGRGEALLLRGKREGRGEGCSVFN